MSIGDSIFPLQGKAFRQGMWRTLRHPSALLGLLTAGLVLALLGPFGTFDRIAMPLRLVYWVLLCLVNAVGAAACLFLISHGKDRYQGMPDLVLLLVTASVANGVPGALIVATTNTLFGLDYQWHVTGLVETGLFVVLITALLNGAFISLELLAGMARSEEADPFEQRIPPALGAELLALSSEDHYLRVYTSAGDALIHCQLKTALAELSPDRGRQVHRSHWVAKVALRGARRVDGRWQLILSTGISIPVSRAKLSELKAAGWLQKLA